MRGSASRAGAAAERSIVALRTPSTSAVSLRSSSTNCGTPGGDQLSESAKEPDLPPTQRYSVPSEGGGTEAFPIVTWNSNSALPGTSSAPEGTLTLRSPCTDFDPNSHRSKELKKVP